jgi:hypothetical protein
VTETVRDGDRVRETEVVRETDDVGFKLGGTVGGPLRLLVIDTDLVRVTVTETVRVVN